MDTKYELVNVVISFANPSYSAKNKDIEKDLKKVFAMVYYNLQTRSGIGISDYRINPEGTFTITLIYPNNLPKYRIPMHLRGIATRLLRLYPERYSGAKIGSRLFNYHIAY